MVYISVSTGIGSGLILRGQLYTGSGKAGELGHICAGTEGRLCGCGRKDCLELYASGTAIENTYESRTGNRLSCKGISALAEQGDETAVSVFKSAAQYIFQTSQMLQTLLDPCEIVVGGGVAESVVFRRFLKESTDQYHIRLRFSTLQGKQALYGVVYALRGNQCQEEVLL